MDIFFSYASGDHDRIEPLVLALQSHGWSVWWDQTILAGQRWDEVIAKALAESSCVVVAWTATSVVSDWVRIEANSGWERRILVPVLLESIEVPLAFRLIQMVSLVGWDGAGDHTGLRELVDGVREVLGRGTRTYPPSVGRTEQRALDAAIARDVPVLEPANLIAMIRLASSNGLRAILEVDDEYGLSPADVASKPFDLEFEVDAAGRLIPPHVSLRVTAPDFDPPTQDKAVRIPPSRDSLILAFLLRPLTRGELTIQIEVYEGKDCLASRLLRSNGVASRRTVSPGSHVIVSLPLLVTVRDSDQRALRSPGDARARRPPLPSEPPPSRDFPMERSRPSRSRGRARGISVGIALLSIALGATASYVLYQDRHALPPVAHAPRPEPVPSSPRPDGDGRPVPVLRSVEIPRSARLGEPFEVRVDAVNLGGPARSGSITVSFSGSPELLIVSSDAANEGRAAIYGIGATMTHAEGGTTRSAQPIAEAYYPGPLWDYRDMHYLLIRVVPRQPGVMTIWVRVTTLAKDPRIRDSFQHDTESVEKDQQGFPARIYHVEVRQGGQ